MSELSRSLTDTAAEAARRERIRSLRDTGKSASDDAQAAQVVAAVLETLAARAHWLKPDNSDGFVTAAEVNEGLRRLAAEVREGD